MAPDEPSGSRPGPVVLRIKLRYDDVNAMVQRFAPNIGKSGLFLPTKSLQPVGTEIKFELRLADDSPVLVGLGRVKAVRPPDPNRPRATFGMAVELTRVTRESRELILRMLDRRRELGLTEIGIPMPNDIDAARRTDLIDTGVRDALNSAVPTPITTPEPSDSVLRAPRRPSGPIDVEKRTSVAALDPEPPRKKRPALNELIERASGPIEAVAGSLEGGSELDDDVDVAAAVARARVLAGGEFDSELDALRAPAEVPAEVSIEAASAELARQLGGKQVTPAPRWAPPPLTISTPPSGGENPGPPALPPAPRAEARHPASEPGPVPALVPETNDAPSIEPSSPIPTLAPLATGESSAVTEPVEQEAPEPPAEQPPVEEPPAQEPQARWSRAITSVGEDDEADERDRGPAAEDLESAIAGSDTANASLAGARRDGRFDHLLSEPHIADQPANFDEAERTQLGAEPVDADALEANARVDEDDDEQEDEEEIEELDEFEILDEDDDEEDTGDRAYTVAEPVATPAIDFDSPHAGYSGVPAFDDSDVIRVGRSKRPSSPMIDPRELRRAKSTPPPSELEAALEALKVDVDDLSIPVEPSRGRTPSRDKPARANTDDGVLIDFDDDEDDDL